MVGFLGEVICWNRTINKTGEHEPSHKLGDADHYPLIILRTVPTWFYLELDYEDMRVFHPFR